VITDPGPIGPRVDKVKPIESIELGLKISPVRVRASLMSYKAYRVL